VPPPPIRRSGSPGGFGPAQPQFFDEPARSLPGASKKSEGAAAPPAPARELLERLFLTDVIRPGPRRPPPFSNRHARGACKNLPPIGPAAIFSPPAGLVVASCLAALVTAAGCEMSSARAMTEAAPDSFTIVALPDTQYYAAAHPEILAAQSDWILRRSHDDRIAAVVHEGDVVDADEPRQWRAAARSLHRLDGVVPWLPSTGNHDYSRNGKFISRNSQIDTYFPPAAFARNAWFGGTFEEGRIENSFAIVEAPGGPWMIISLEFGPRDAVLAWADQVAKRYAALPTIVVTHAYLYSDGTRYDHLNRPDQLWNPHAYLPDGETGQVNDGEEIWRKLIVRNRNVLFVLCGHDLADGVAELTSARPDGTLVHQVLANYQTGKLGGEGFLRVMRFFPSERRVAIHTYSPYLDRFKSDADNEFSLAY